MSRELSPTAIAALFSQQTSEVFLLTLTVSHDDLPATVRLVNNTVDVTSGGELYLAFPFDLVLPNEDNERISRSTLRIANVDRSIIGELRALNSPASAVIRVILASEPDTIVAGPFDFLIRQVAYERLHITCDLAYEDILNNPLPKDTFNPSEWRGLFE